MGEARRRKLAGTVRTIEETAKWFAVNSLRYQGAGVPSRKAQRTPKSLFLLNPIVKKALK